VIYLNTANVSSMIKVSMPALMLNSFRMNAAPGSVPMRNASTPQTPYLPNIRTIISTSGIGRADPQRGIH
jgi:hypothetical protein